MQQRSVRRVCARVAFVDLFAARIKNLDAAEGRLNFFRKPNANLVRRCLERTTHSRLRGLEKSVSFNSRRTSQDNHKQAEDRPFHLLPPNIERPRLRGKRVVQKEMQLRDYADVSSRAFVDRNDRLHANLEIFSRPDDARI